MKNSKIVALTKERNILKATVIFLLTTADCPLSVDKNCEFNPCGSAPCIKRIKKEATS